MPEITFTVYTKPEPQGSIKAFYNKHTGMASLTSDNKKLKPYRHTVTAVAKDAMRDCSIVEPMADKHVPVELALEFVFLRPKAVSKRRIFPVVKPDIDKLERATLDALTGVLFADDAQVVIVSKMKSYGPVEQVHISARVIEQPGKLLPMRGKHCAPGEQGVLL